VEGNLSRGLKTTRPKYNANNKAKLIEITSAETLEVETSAKRKKAMKV
jgi:hypothetical protein